MTTRERGRALHVERTSDPSVLRWVCHDERLVGGSPARDSSTALGRLLATHEVASITAEGGDLLVEAPSWDRERIDLVTAAVRTAFDADELSWCRPSPLTHQRATEAIADAVGHVVELHGGSVRVVDVSDRDGNTEVVVELNGACRGCPGATETIHGRARDALVRIDPSVRLVAFDSTGHDSTGHEPTGE